MSHTPAFGRQAPTQIQLKIQTFRLARATARKAKSKLFFFSFYLNTDLNHD